MFRNDYDDLVQKCNDQENEIEALKKDLAITIDEKEELEAKFPYIVFVVFNNENENNWMEVQHVLPVGAQRLHEIENVWTFEGKSYHRREVIE
jgi:hypothetical protein